MGKIVGGRGVLHRVITYRTSRYRCPKLHAAAAETQNDMSLKATSLGELTR